MIGRAKFLALYALFIVAALYLNLHRDTGVPMKRPFEQFPSSVSRWRMQGENVLSADVQAVLKASDVLLRQYVGAGGDRVTFYIGYHDGGKEAGEIHSPKHCLPGSGWFEVSSRRTRVEVPGGALNLVRAVYQKGESKELFLYWYQVRGQSISEEYSLKLAEIANSVLYGRRDAAFIRISVPFGGSEERAQATGERFVADFYPVIREFLPI
ncbi:EpsI family protein [Geomonas silvestris]|uniref:EpsI family protein n=1 Tax=Geomonas silvestris TaxID=2740184 RepID=A0A6V8MDK8_9BACT|nr:exosortase C-terminal domain/associated protein EpsI [Geomonas silvestris]GFO57759.1 EpsI family protein [Geomonas silvestris]